VEKATISHSRQSLGHDSAAMDRLPVSLSPNPVLSRWIGQIEKSIASRKLFRDGQKILLAVSGGLDSIVLLHVLQHLAGAHGWKLTVAHFNHQLRGSAGDADERLVRQTARRLGLQMVAGRGNVAATARTEGISLEMAGRKLRHDFLARTARRHRIPAIALAHHADDQVELFFLRLLRGTGNRGLAGMQWSNPSPSDPAIALVRPLLDQSKTVLREAAQAAGVRFAEDATNASIDIHRNRVRHKLLPLLRQHYQPRLAERVLRLMELAGAEAEVVTELAERWLAAQRRVKFERLPIAVQRSVLYLQLLRMGHTPDFELVERLRANGRQPVAVGPEQWVSRDAGSLLRARKIKTPAFDSDRIEMVLTAKKGRAALGGLAVAWEILKAPGDKFARQLKVEHFDADKVGGTVWLRHWQAGDRFQPIGMNSARKLQDLFTDLKVPREERHRRVVAVTSRGELFWVEGLRMAEGFKLEPGTVRRLKWQWRRRKL
jgi:tRNA(Ile)-lysidine synthase